MAKRPVYVASKDGKLSVTEKHVEFKWYPGMAKSQKQKSVVALHSAAESKGVRKVLEVSSKSESELGVALSAFNLMIRTKHKQQTFSVECAFQASKVFERGGPYTDLLHESSRAAKKDLRLKDSGNLVNFMFFGKSFPLKPRTFFYDWLYINALKQNENLADDVLQYDGFTDIEFNPVKSINCQAFSAALFVSLSFSSLLADALESPEIFADVVSAVYGHRASVEVQGSLV